MKNEPTVKLQSDQAFWLIPMILMFRAPTLAMEAQRGGRFGPETSMAVGEKVTATCEGIVASQLSMWSSMMEFWPDIISGKTPALLSGQALQSCLNASSAPTRKRLRANYRRLSKKALTGL